MPSRTLRFLAPAVLVVASLPAVAFGASTQPSWNTGSVAVTTGDTTELRTSGSQSHGRFNGQVAIANAEVKYFFRYAVDTGGSFEWTNQTATQEAAAANTSLTVNASDEADDLAPNTTYLVRLVAKLSDGSLRGGSLVRFTTPAASSGGSGSSGSGSSGSGNSGSGSGNSGSGSGNSGSGPGVFVPLPAPFNPGSATTATDDSRDDDDSSAPETDASKPAPAAATPEAGRSVGIAPAKGTVLVRRPGSGDYVQLAAGSAVPMGSVVDTRKGQVALTSELPSGKTQTGYFNGGLFLVRQSGDGTVNLYLQGPVCGRPGASRRNAKRTATAAASRAGRRSGRRLFGRDKGGKFRTHGRNSHATVRGTKWLVEDRCDGTVTKVSEGAVMVRDLTTKRRILVKAGGRYLARAKR